MSKQTITLVIEVDEGSPNLVLGEDVNLHLKGAPAPIAVGKCVGIADDDYIAKAFKSEEILNFFANQYPELLEAAEFNCS